MKIKSSYWKKFIVTGAVLLIAFSSFSQAKPDTVKPVLTASIGSYINGGKAVSTDLKRLMTLNPVVKVKDAKGTEFKVMAFEMTWKKKEQSEDLKTGKPKTVFYMVGADVKTNQIPESWREQIGAEVKSGEEIAFNNIIYNDPKKKANYKLKGGLTLTVL